MPSHPAGEDASSPQASQVIARAATILRALEPAPNGLTIAELSRASALPRTTVHRLVASLEAEQLLAVTEGRVRLGPALLRLAASTHRDVVAVARPHVEALSQALQESVHVWIERTDCVECVHEVVALREVRVAAPPGFRLPFVSSAPGKVLLAGLDDNEVLARWRLSDRASHGDVAWRRFHRGITATRRSGVAVDLEDHAEDVAAAAVRLNVGHPERYALAVPAPVRRFRMQRHAIVAALQACAARIEAAVAQR